METIHRGNQYVRAIQLYYRKVGHYPGNMEQLEKTNNMRFLRQRYVDPMTGKQDWRLIHVGEAKTTVKGFFGQPLAGIASSGLAAARRGRLRRRSDRNDTFSFRDAFERNGLVFWIVFALGSSPGRFERRLRYGRRFGKQQLFEWNEEPVGEHFFREARRLLSAWDW